MLILLGGTLGVGAIGLGALRLGLPAMLRGKLPRPLGRRARRFVEQCFAGIDRSRIWDSHVHLMGFGAGGTGCWVNPEMRSHMHPIKRLQYDLFRAALGMDSEQTADADYVERLLALQRHANPMGKLVVFAFDQFVTETGEERPELSSFYTPNDHVVATARLHPELIPCASVHPYRLDALERLDRAAEGGARAVKWLPNAMGIDPASSRCDAFYRRLVELDLPLISHAGRELATDSAGGQELGNPLRLRRALDAGVRVVVAHCASLGQAADLDAPGSPQVPAFDLFMRLMRQQRFAGSLFGDISCVTQINRSPRVVRELLLAPELHPRLVHGSDYPIPALTMLFHPGRLRLAGLVDADDTAILDELAEANPLLHDFALKRSVRVEQDGTTYRFADRVFETDWLFRPRADSTSG